jgi:hypothetical protein
MEMYARNSFEKTWFSPFFKKEEMCNEIVCTPAFGGTGYDFFDLSDGLVEFSIGRLHFQLTTICSQHAINVH